MQGAAGRSGLAGLWACTLSAAFDASNVTILLHFGGLWLWAALRLAHGAGLTGLAYRLVIRKALTIRDGGCTFPNCTAPDTACEAHHVIPWHLDGPTTLGNLVLLCAHHHAVIEPQRFNDLADQWTITFDPDTRKPVITPTKRMRVYLGGRDRQ